MTRTELLKTAKLILFNTEMVRAILDGRKTQTRRIIKQQPANGIRKSIFVPSGIEDNHGYEVKWCFCPGDILYVRETWWMNNGKYYYLADNELLELAKKLFDITFKCRPSIHMPKEAARIFLRVTNVRVERLQDISEADAIAEGITPCKGYLNGDDCCCATQKYADLWNSTVNKSNLTLYGWDANPYVFVYEFERLMPEGE